MNTNIKTAQTAVLNRLYKLWDRLGDVPVNEDCETEEQFLFFEAGTSTHEIWHWFEAQHPDFVVAEVQQGNRKDVTSDDQLSFGYIVGYADEGPSCPLCSSKVDLPFGDFDESEPWLGTCRHNGHTGLYALDDENNDDCL